MIRYVKHRHIDRKKYDHCVRKDPAGLVYAFSWYLDLVCESWDILVLKDYSAVWPLPVRRKFGMKYFFRPYAVQQLGIFSPEPLQQESLDAFIKAMQRQCVYSDVYLNENQFPQLQSFNNLKGHINLNLCLDLQRSYREIHHGFSQNTRRNIAKASKNKLELFEQDDPAALISIFKANRGKDLALSNEFYRNVEQVMYKCLHNGMGKVWTVYDVRNTTCAGIFVVETEKRSVLLFTCLSEEGRDLRAMHYLLNEYIIYESGKDRVLDFEGSNLKSLARFYGGFGADEKHYLRIVYNGLPLPLRWLKS